MNTLSEIIGKSYMLYAMTGIFLLGVISRFFLNLTYRGLLRDIGNLPAPQSRILKQIKLKYESCDKLDMQICNTEAFVKKNLYEYRVCGTSVRAMEKILGQAMFFGMLTGIGAAIFATLAGLDKNVIIVHIAATVFGAALLFNYDRLSDIAYKRQVVETGLVDFLENHLQMHFLAQERAEAEESVNAFETVEEKAEGKLVDFMEARRSEEKEIEASVEDNLIIEEVLKEFFG